MCEVAYTKCDVPLESQHFEDIVKFIHNEHLCSEDMILVRSSYRRWMGLLHALQAQRWLGSGYLTCAQNLCIAGKELEQLSVFQRLAVPDIPTASCIYN